MHLSRGHYMACARLGLGIGDGSEAVVCPINAGVRYWRTRVIFGQAMNEHELLAKCLDGLRAALPGGGTVEAEPEAAQRAGGDDADGWLHVRGPWGAMDIPYEAKGHVSEATISLLNRRMGGSDGGARASNPPWILLTNYVNGNQARRLNASGIAFADAQGNAHVWGPGLYVWVSGNRPTTSARKTTALTRATAARVLFVLLQDPRRARAPYREIAAQAGVVLDTVHRVFHALAAKGYLKVGEGRERMLTRMPELHELWMTAYEDGLRPKLQPKRCVRLVGAKAGGLGLSLADAADEAQWFLGGEAAAAELTGATRPTEATVHTVPDQQRAVMQALGLVPRPDGPITLLHTFGETNEWRDPKRPAFRLADPLLIHAELLRMGDDRASAAAAQVYERYVQARFSSV